MDQYMVNMRDSGEPHMEPGECSSAELARVAELAQLFEEYRNRLVAMVRRRLDSSLSARIDAEDIINDAYLVAHRKWTSFQKLPVTSPYAWLYGIVRDCLIAAWRTHTRDRRDVRADMPWPDASSVLMGLNLIATDTSPSAGAARDEICDRVRQALLALKDIDREILWMRHYDKLTYSEAGAILGIPENAATLRYVRALKRLKAIWVQGNPDDGTPKHDKQF